MQQIDKINIRIPDLISNSAKNYTQNRKFEIEDNSDYELDSRSFTQNEKSVNFDLKNKHGPSSRYTSIQMQHEVY